MKKGFLAVFAVAILAALAYIPAAKVSSPFWGPPAPESIRVMFGGDIMLDRNVARTARAEGASTLFAGIAERFNDSDIRIANLEGTITTNPSIAQRDNTILRFTFDPEMAKEALAPLNLSAASLANNHALDFYEKGYLRTQVYTEEFGIKPFGHPLNKEGSLSTSVQYNDKNFCFVGYHSLFDADTAAVVAEIAKLRPECWKIVVMPHWGEEYVHTARAGQREAAREFIDAGADLVVGAHPHVVQDHEVYKGKAIFYSLGNFMFDQNFSWGTTHGMLLQADFSDTKTVFTVIPTTILDQKAGLAEGEDRQKILDIAGVARLELP
jgi:poly-gamma-glutamate synthesis protein (capsule biosynthesis protein)